MNLPEQVVIKEVGPRDGLQNEPQKIPTDQKIEWINRLSDTGLSYIEITSFVHPKWIPQLADALEVAKSIRKKKGITYAALVPNLKGLERALEADIDEVSVFMSASETHNKKNINKTIKDTYPVLEEVVNEAKKHNKSVRGYVSTVFGCPYEGEVSVDQVIDVSRRLFDMGIDELSLGDTIGVAHPKQVEEVLLRIKDEFPNKSIALHFHDTRGTALANCLTAMQLGFNTFDASLGGLGGCPYAKGASGNVATDDLLYMLDGMGIETGIDFQKLLDAAGYIQRQIQKPLPSHQMQIVHHQKESEQE
ncbi:hydroxymethylglutaryl-CoA lyase [Melghiribacillus thermohalophilus]|uniref:Hydroxymethylglutaryl-CoA lyase n=1 Tax=Melghiribacillus thermohalophilus TaxID=1324956 RepID=A0A4R3MVL7_9BACI|nr:hydroxymethylglutaryl-CoA lyase [Melghiribacillus thermohalophilus]TCT17594.1 hydroxymethylglutaryl-CoA lyase [Melghiribacillus thermohalophilus]